MSDTELHALAKELLKLRKRREKIEGEEDTNWRRVYEIADDAVGVLKGYRWLDVRLSKVIGRTMATSHRIDIAKLQDLLSPEQWMSVTSAAPRVLDTQKLEAAVAAKKIDAEAVQEATSTTETARKLLGEPNREERDAINVAKKAAG